MHHDKFTACADGLAKLAGIARTRECQHIYRKAAAQLKSSQRFYVPDATTDLIQGRKIDDEIRRQVRLPFPHLAILSETRFVDNTGNTSGHGWRVTLCREISDDTFELFSCFQDLKTSPMWLGTPIKVVCSPKPGPVGYDMRIVADCDEAEMIAAGNPRHVGKEFEDDLVSVVQLCLLLAIRGTEAVPVPRAPNPNIKKPEKHKPKSVLDYHVLRVGGDVWDTNLSVQGAGGVRSHFRRGHIRIISGERPVWVRHTVVHGSKPGFVSKEYHV